MTGKRRYFFEVSYNGTAYHGWQIQPGQDTVQGVIEANMVKFIDDFDGITGSGRTDTGVHCIQQFFHADVPDSFDKSELQYKLNRMLPSDISINAVRRVATSAHARFDAVSRSYEYRISRVKDPFRPKMTFWFEKLLNIDAMNEVAGLLLTYENYESFSKVRTEVNHFLCNIILAEWVEEDSQLVLYITANRFLRGMVRALVGTMLEIGEGKRKAIDFKAILDAQDRRMAGPAAPAEGLFLVSVIYPDKIFLD